MSNFLLPILGTVARFIKADFVRKTAQTAIVQEKYLLNLLQLHQNTEIGIKYGLSEIKTVDEFREKVPILPYSSYENYTERIFNGESNLLTPDPVAYLNLTSGSTGTRKIIPVTKRFQSSLGKANLTSIGFLSEALQAQGKTMGKILITNSAKILGRSPGGIDYGIASVGVLRMGKWMYEQLFANPFESLLIDDSLSRHYICILFALCEPSMRGIAANFPMLIIRICNYLEKYAEDLIQDIENGTIADWLKLEPEIRSQLENQWYANPQRAQELRQILTSEGKLTPKKVWENLSFIGTARGGTSDFYFERFPEYLGNTSIFGAVYSSAEATFSMYSDLDKDGSILAIESGFFEFIPEDQWDEEKPKTILATEVEVGERYRILTTNYSGFYRYDIGDVIEVVGFYNTAPLIVFRHRRGGFVSATSEKTTEYHITQVMQTLQQKHKLILEDFCLTLSEEIPSHYLINIELAPGQILNNPQAFLDDFDRQLSIENTSYGIKRPNNYLPAPRLRILAPGSFAIIKQRQLAKGIPDSQLKFPHLTEDRQYLAGLEVLEEIQLPEKSQQKKQEFSSILM